MVQLIPFRAIRPVRDKVHLVATRPIYSYKKNVLKSKLIDNPFTFLHIINPKFDGQRSTQPNTPERFEQVKQGYQQFIDAQILIQDEHPHLYIYRQTKEDHVFTGIIAGASNQEYRSDKIKKHEANLTHREQLFIDYLDVVGYNAEPVLLTHKHDPQIKRKIEDCIKKRPEYEFSTSDQIKHELWILDPDQTKEIQQLFLAIDSLYIADGHHRSASSVGLEQRRILQNKTQFPNQSGFLSFIIDEHDIHILEFNRLIRSLNGMSEQEFIRALSPIFDIKKCEPLTKPQKEHHIVICIKNVWYELNYKINTIDSQHPVKSLDTELVTEHILKPILGIQDIKTNQNITFIGGTISHKKIAKWIKKRKYELAIFLYPLTIEQIKHVADNQLTMPPKSTWIEPKLRSGLTIYPINE